MNEVAEDPLAQPMRRWNNVAGAIDYYRQQGVPAHKLVLGVPFYGRGWTGVPSGGTNGLYQPATGPAPPRRGGTPPFRGWASPEALA